MGPAGLSGGGGDLVDQDVAPGGELGSGGLDGPGVHPADDQPVDGVGLDAGIGQCSAIGGPGELGVPGLAEALLPQAGPGVAGAAPPVKELVGGSAAADDLRDHRCVVRPLADDDSGGRVATAGLVRAGGKAVAQVGGHHKAVARAVERAEEGPGPRAE